MEIDITALVAERDMSEFSASRAELGNNAAKITWANACDRASEDDPPLLSTDQLPRFRRYVKEFGAWSEEEIAAWDHGECCALMIQFAAGDVREAQSLTPGDGLGDIDWPAYEKLAEEGTASGRIFTSADRIYYSID